MHARALICDENQGFRLTDVILPDPGQEHIVVRTHYSGVSIGTEFAVIRGKLSWGPYPLCTGYQGFKVGDRVYYRSNRVLSLPDGQKVSGASGVHCSAAVTPANGVHAAALLPEGVAEDAASLFVMPAVGLNGVDTANPRMGEVVAIYGSGLIGLGVVAACSHRGCVVVAIDVEEGRLEVARKLGADYAINGSHQNVKEELLKIAPAGADVVFEATGIPACIDPAIDLCRPYGKFVLQGNYGQAPISYHFLPPHGKRLTMHYPCDDGFVPCRRAVLKNMAMGVLPWRHTITHRVEASDAPALYDAINKGGGKDVLGAVICWS